MDQVSPKIQINQKSPSGPIKSISENDVISVRDDSVRDVLDIFVSTEIFLSVP